MNKFHHLQRACVAYLKAQDIEIPVRAHVPLKPSESPEAAIEVGCPIATKVNPFLEGPFFEEVIIPLQIYPARVGFQESFCLYELAGRVIAALHNWDPPLEGIASPLNLKRGPEIITDKAARYLEVGRLEFSTAIDGI
jgi:hypothetical protein